MTKSIHICNVRLRCKSISNSYSGFSIEAPAELVFQISIRILMENIGGGMAAPLKSAVGPIWLGRQLG